MSAQVFFVTEAADGVLAIPVSALAENGSLRVQGAAGNVPETRRPVIGMRTRSHVAILSGLDEGERVATGEGPVPAEPLLRIAP